MPDVEKSEVAKKEEETLAFWEREHIFEKSLAQPAPKGDFVFYDGPPFATGLPHYGHIVASVIKDAIPRYKTMQGYRVPRRWGWDTHGLPIENVVEKELGFTHKKDIKQYGVEKFNERCRELVLGYVGEWKKIIPRIGRFVDMEHSYTTMDASFMESVWWVFKQIYDKGLVYEDYRSMHICPRCETTLSQQEVAEGYKDVKDISVTVKFKVTNPEKLGLSGDVYLLAWTTTPWTLPGNVALAVGKETPIAPFVYVAWKENNETVITSAAYYAKLKGAAMTPGSVLFGPQDLIGLEYEPPFDYYKKDANLKNRENGWKVYAADFVTTDTGTGIVHIAPAFGEDDMVLGKEKNLPFVQHVAYDGTMRPEVTDFAGQPVKPRSDDDKVRLGTDIAVIKYLQEHGTFFSKENIVHSYPHCWRCDTPLLNYATTSWFVEVTALKNELIEHAKKINWTPAHVKDGRFGKWLEGARDWSISRQRFWASVIPLWKDAAGGITAIGSVEELKKHTKKSGNTYFVMRHGEAEHNVADILNGEDRGRYPLTAEGRAQAIAAANVLAGERVGAIYASPFLRAQETAKIIAQKLGIPETAIITDDRLRELGFGTLEGTSYKKFLAYRDTHPIGFDEPVALGGESYQHAKNRFAEFLYELERSVSHKTILVITHGIGVETFEAVVRGAGKEESKKLLGPLHAHRGELRKFDFVPLPHNANYELDLHLPYIDNVQLVNETGEPLIRVPDVLDTWFDSGSMPYAQAHYPFEHKDDFEKTFPAQFIAEGIDQTRAWFYYLHVLSSAALDTNAFENVIVNGTVLAEDGKKMSKKLQNYPDPMLLVDTYGADAMRFYLLASPVVEAENLAFTEGGVDEVAKKNIGRLTNTLSFYALFADGTPASPTSTDLLDRWIFTRLKELVQEATAGYERYELDRAVRPVALFVDDLSAWYVRRSRDRFKEEGGGKTAALATLRYVLKEFSKVIAPSMPFIAEQIFQNVREEKDSQSVHLAEWPEALGISGRRKNIRRADGTRS